MAKNNRKQNMTADILMEYVAGGLSGETTEIVQGWIASDKFSSQEKDTELENIWNRVVGYRPVPSKEAYRMYGEVSKRLGFPEESRPLRRNSLRRMLPRIAAVLVPIVAVIGSYFMFNTSDDWKTEVFSAGHGNRIEVVLPDGTVVWLNEDTRLVSEDERTVSLEGEAYFKVAPMDGTQFVVNAGEMSVTVLGTEFSVYAVPVSDEVSVTLYEGSVRVTTPEDEITLEPEQKLEINRFTGEATIAAAHVRMPGWMATAMTFERKPLADIFVSLEDVFGVRFVFDAGLVEGQLVTLKLRGNETLAETMFLLSQVSGTFTYEIDGDTIIVR